eukprot:6491488-Amphidinium_carterae.2
MVRVEVKDRVQVVNQSKIRKNHDPWHDVPRPPQLMDAQAEDQSRDLSQCLRDLDQTIQDTFTIPKTKRERENLKDKLDVRSVLFRAYTKQGSGCSHSCSKHANVLKAIHRLARTRPKQGPYLAAQLNLDFRHYGGRLWIEEESTGSSELVPPPTPIENGEKAKGRYHSTKGKWLKSDGNSLHAVEVVKDKGTRYSLTLFVPKYLNHLTEGHWQELQSHGFDAKHLHKMSGQASYFAGHSWLGLEDLSYLGTVFAVLAECSRDPITSADKTRLTTHSHGSVGQYRVRSSSNSTTHYIITNLPHSHLSYIVSPTSDGVESVRVQYGHSLFAKLKSVLLHTRMKHIPRVAFQTCGDERNIWNSESTS